MRLARATLEAAGGLLVAPVGTDGVWQAFRTLRAGLAAEAGPGARAAFVTALAADGSITHDALEAAVLVLGYRPS